MDDYLDLLDYDEEDLNSDLKTLSEINDYKMTEDAVEDLRNQLRFP